MMKQILLGVSAVLAEVLRRELGQFLCRYFAPVPEIRLSQDALDPNIDWEGADALVGEEHYAICDLRTHAGQFR